jgi:putative hydrolase of the HAD superfamily
MTAIDSNEVLALDAMGVIYEVGDDVADLLIPFIRERGGLADPLQIEALYEEASLGRLPAGEFWRRVSLSHELEDEYLSRLRLSDGVPEFLAAATARFDRVVCLSNDLSRWSRKLRQRLGLEAHFAHWFISGDLGVRKPDREIYERMLAKLGVQPAQVVFVDDRVKNLDAARQLGIQTVYYGVDVTARRNGHRSISRLVEILDEPINERHAK